MSTRDLLDKRRRRARDRVSHQFAAAKAAVWFALLVGLLAYHRVWVDSVTKIEFGVEVGGVSAAQAPPGSGPPRPGDGPATPEALRGLNGTYAAAEELLGVLLPPVFDDGAPNVTLAWQALLSNETVASLVAGALGGEEPTVDSLSSLFQGATGELEWLLRDLLEWLWLEELPRLFPVEWNATVQLSVKYGGRIAIERPFLSLDLRWGNSTTRLASAAAPRLVGGGSLVLGLSLRQFVEATLRQMVDDLVDASLAVLRQVNVTSLDHLREYFGGTGYFDRAFELGASFSAELGPYPVRVGVVADGVPLAKLLLEEALGRGEA